MLFQKGEERGRKFFSLSWYHFQTEFLHNIYIYIYIYIYT